MPKVFRWWKPDIKRSLGRPKHIGEDNIKLDLKQNRRTGRHGLDYLAVSKDNSWALVRMVMNLQVP